MVTPDGAILSADVMQRKGPVPSRARSLQPHNYSPFLLSHPVLPDRRLFSKLGKSVRTKTTVRYEAAFPITPSCYATKHVPRPEINMNALRA